MRQKRILFFGNFGTNNLGNECTLRAIIENARIYLPQAHLRCVCPEPEVASRYHGIETLPLSYRYAGDARPGAAPRRGGPVGRFVRRLLVRLPLEVVDWVKALRTLSGTDMLVMTGTGMLSDFGSGGPLGLHYEILKWSIAARLRRCRVLFVSVGASGPIRSALSRFMLKASLRLAWYRSYRDGASRRYLESLGVDTSEHHVYPDLVFSLPVEGALASPERDPGGRVIGLGLMEFYGEHTTKEQGERIYRDYVARVGRFAAWLLGRGYTLRLLVGDLAYDNRVKQDLYRTLEELGVSPAAGQIVDVPVSSEEDVWTELACTSMVVASRFHNLLFSLMLNKPVMALSYHAKVVALMEGMELSRFLQDIKAVDVDRLIEQFQELERSAATLKPAIAAKVAANREALAEQYRRIFLDA